MNLNKVFLTSFIVLMLSSYQTDSSILFTLFMKLLMIKGALFMSMPLSMGAFVMGQGMGFFAGNMAGGYMMLRAANRYHNKEKGKWVTHSNWHGPPYYTNTYQSAYDRGKAISDALNAGKNTMNSIASIFHRPKPSYGPPAAPAHRPPRPQYGPPSHTPGWPSSNPYGSYSEILPSVAEPTPYSYPPLSYGNPPSPSGLGGASPLNYYSGRQNGFSSVLSSLTGASNTGAKNNQNIRRIHQELSPSGFYTSAYKTPGQEFTGILTNEPDTQGGKYLKGTDSQTGSESFPQKSSTSAPNEVLESYLEQRLKAEAEKQKDTERKEEAQQLVQMLRKAYLKQLVDSIKEEETTIATSRKLAAPSLTNTIESLFGSRESRSVEQKENDSSNSKNLIRDLLINEVFTSSESSQTNDKIDTAEVESITERILGLTSTEREELVKGLDEIEEEEVSIPKPEISLQEEELQGEELQGEGLQGVSASTENIINSTEGSDDKKSSSRSDEGPGVLDMIMPAQWVPTDNNFNGNAYAPFAIRVRRQANPLDLLNTQIKSSGETNQGAGLAAVGAGVGSAEQKQIEAFVNDIRKFFTLLSALDQDQCLQKLVCDVHTNEKDLSTLTQYEQNILTTFKLMKTLMPEGEEDSSTKYRYAAVVGETGQSMELCQQTYTPCGFSTTQIVALGTQQEVTPMDWAQVQSDAATASPTVSPVTAQQEQSTTPSPQTAQSQRRSEYVTPNAPSRRRFQQPASTGYPERNYRPRPQQEPAGFFNYGDFSEFFRSLWSDTVMGKRSRRTERTLRHRMRNNY